MIIISHRGYWKSDKEKNTMTAFRRSFDMGFGAETDVRDYNGTLVIAHDCPTSAEDLIPLADFFALYNTYKTSLPLALNIKSDGLQSKLALLLTQYNITNYFVFDMSIPDTVLYQKHNQIYFMRASEFEDYSQTTLYQQSNGIWLDHFESNYVTETHIQEHLDHKKKVCIVSPELHKRSYVNQWHIYKQFKDDDQIMVCTDFPEDLQKFISHA